MNCEYYLELLSPFVDNELDENRVNQVLEHIETCANCKEQLEDLMIISASVGTLKEYTMPESLHNEIMDGVRASKGGSNNKRYAMFSGLAAVLALMITLPFLGEDTNLNVSPIENENMVAPISENNRMRVIEDEASMMSTNFMSELWEIIAPNKAFVEDLMDYANSSEIKYIDQSISNQLYWSLQSENDFLQIQSYLAGFVEDITVLSMPSDISQPIDLIINYPAN